MEYDSAALELVEAVPGDVLQGINCQINDTYTPNSLRVTFASAYVIESAGDLIRMSFRIRERASLGDAVLSIQNVKLMDLDARAISVTANGSAVTVQGVTISVSSANVIAGESFSLDLTILEPVAPCGAEITLTYDPAMLEFGKITPVKQLGQTAISVVSAVNKTDGIIRFSWASATPIDGFGKICTIQFTAKDNVDGVKELSFSNVRFVDENGNDMVYAKPEPGQVVIARRQDTIPELFFEKRAVDADSGTVTICAALQGATSVYGGDVKIQYDAELCTLVEIKPLFTALTINPIIPENASGTVALAWAASSPMEANQQLVQLTFRMPEEATAEIDYAAVNLSDRNGASIDPINTGRITVFISEPEPCTQIESLAVNDKSIEGSIFCVHDISASVLSACYDTSGRMCSIEVIPLTAGATNDLSLQLPKDTSLVKWFVINDKWIPQCQSAENIIGSP